jgi:hypothetical protein
MGNSLLEIKKHRLSEEEFNSMSIMDKRAYIIQEEQDETNWWLRTWAKINVYCFLLALGIGALAILIKATM